VKATVNDETSSNGTARIEWEVDLAPMTIEEMDALVLSAGFIYQAKWSRAREGYALGKKNKQNPPTPLIRGAQNPDTALCLDKNA
jgi:hypothetical protein